MTIAFSPYLAFRGNAREAMEFYRSIFGGELNVLTFEAGGMTSHGAVPEQVMHSALTGPVALLAADQPAELPLTAGGSVSLALMGGDEDETVLRGWFDALGDGASEVMALDAAPWGDVYGQLVDRFGIAWMVNISAAPTPA